MKTCEEYVLKKLEELEKENQLLKEANKVLIDTNKALGDQLDEEVKKVHSAEAYFKVNGCKITKYYDNTFSMILLDSYINEKDFEAKNVEIDLDEFKKLLPQEDEEDV